MIALLATMALAGPPAPSSEAKQPTELAAARSADVSSQPAELWAGRVAVFGKRKIPLLGHVRYRTDNYVLAKVTRTGGEFHLEQRVCKVAIEKTAGAAVRFPEQALRSMPLAYPVFRADPVRSGYAADAWPSGWDASDHDGDGAPGISVIVKAPICGGVMHMESHAESTAQGTFNDAGGISGEVQILIKQVILGAQGACLRLLSKDFESVNAGHFAYLPVPADTTCDTVDEASAWPDPVPSE